MIGAAAGEHERPAAASGARARASTVGATWLGGAPILGDASTRFRIAWPLHVVRYGLSALAVAAIAAASPAPARHAGALAAVCVALLVDLAIHGRRSTPSPVSATVLVLPQLAAAVAVLGLAPGPAGVLMLAASVAGAGLVLAPLLAGAAAAAALGFAVWAVAPSSGVGGIVVLAGSVVLAAWLGRWWARHVDLTLRHRDALADLTAGTERTADLIETRRALAVTEERRRLAAEVHDELGHALVGTLIQLRVARASIPTEPDAATRRLERLEEEVSSTLANLRRSLQAADAGTAHGTTLSASLERLAREFAADGGPAIHLRIDPVSDGVDDIAPERAHALYRVAQEALTNAVRHGRAGRIEVRVTAPADRVRLSVHDDGAGADEIHAGMGLSGMVARVQAVGGAIRFRTRPGEGFLVEASVRRR